MFTHARYLRVLMSSEDRRKGILTVLTLLMLNASCLMAAWTLLHTKSLVFTAALMAYLLGLRHAFDADHIAAIDNATRKLLEQEARPLFVGLYFSLGHATVVLGVCALLLATGGSGPRAPWVDRTRRRASQHGLLGGVAFHARGIRLAHPHALATRPGGKWPARSELAQATRSEGTPRESSAERDL